MKHHQSELKDIGYYVRTFTRLHVNSRQIGPSPHKPVLLLSILEFFEANEINLNQIEFSPRLVDRFAAIFAAVRGPYDRCNPVLPFIHLSSDRFWHLKAKQGKEAVLAAVSQIRTQWQLHELVEYAYVDEELFTLLLDRSARGILRQVLLDHWFHGSTSQTVESVLMEERETIHYQNFIERGVQGDLLQEAQPQPKEKVRSEAFRRSVREAYDYRCAACGWRVLLPNGSPLVEAAHLIQFAENYDDDPRNGMALSPTYHDLMDANIIAPGPDLKWHVSPLIDPRIPDNRDLCSLAGQRILLPHDKRYYPRRDALELRLKKLTR